VCRRFQSRTSDATKSLEDKLLERDGLILQLERRNEELREVSCSCIKTLAERNLRLANGARAKVGYSTVIKWAAAAKVTGGANHRAAIQTSVPKTNAW
jgi:hypothetical protein